MKAKKGMTLIEVILALFLLGLITVVFLPSTWSSYRMMEKAKNITVDLYASQQSIEQEMEKTRDKIYEYKKDSTKPNPMINSIMAFGKTIKGITIEKTILSKDGKLNRGTIYTFIADTPIVNESLPEIEWVKLQNKDNKEEPIYWKDNNLTGSHKIKDNTNYFMSLKRWYVSKPGFDGNIPSIVGNESLWGTRYPSWPNDYELIKNDDKDKLSDLRNYYGRHIVYSVIPVAKSGKYGVEKASKPVYIIGPPKLDNITFHLDPYSLRDRNGKFIVDGVFSQWKDYSQSTNNEFNFNYGSTSAMNLSYIPNDGKTLILNNSKSTIAYNPTVNNNFTIFVVYKNSLTDASKSQSIITRFNNNQNGWELKLNGGKLELILKNNTGSSKSLLQNANAENEKYIISCIVSNSNFKMILDKEDNKEEMKSDFNFSINNQSVSTQFGDIQSGENIYEIIIYNLALSNEDVNLVRKYLSEKHKIMIKE